MASRAKHERNVKRMHDLKTQKPILNSKKKILKEARNVEMYKQIIENINKKLLNLMLPQLQRDTLNKEKHIYETKIKTYTLGNADMWKKQAEINILGKEAGCCKLRNRCNIPNCSRPRGVFRKFGLCRLHIRELAGARLLAAKIRKESW